MCFLGDFGGHLEAVGAPCTDTGAVGLRPFVEGTAGGHTAGGVDGKGAVGIFIAEFVAALIALVEREVEDDVGAAGGVAHEAIDDLEGCSARSVLFRRAENGSCLDV